MIVSVPFLGYTDLLPKIVEALNTTREIYLIPATEDGYCLERNKIGIVRKIKFDDTTKSKYPAFQIECEEAIGHQLILSKKLGTLYKLKPRLMSSRDGTLAHGCNEGDLYCIELIPIPAVPEKPEVIAVDPEKIKRDFLDKNPEGTLFYTFGTLAGEILKEICEKANDTSIKAFSSIYHNLTNKINMLEKHEVTDPYIYSLLTRTARETVSRLFGDKVYASYAHNCIQGALKKHNEKGKLISYRQAEQKVLSVIRKSYSKAFSRIIGVERQKWGWVFSYEPRDENNELVIGEMPIYVHKNGFMCNWAVLRCEWQLTHEGWPTSQELGNFFVHKATSND